MLLSGKLKPATVSVPLDGDAVAPPPVLPHAAVTNTSAARAARNFPEASLGFIELFSLPPVGLPIQPWAKTDSSIYAAYAVLKAVARRAAGARWSLIPRGISSRSTAERDSSVAIARTATSTAPANSLV